MARDGRIGGLLTALGPVADRLDAPPAFWLAGADDAEHWCERCAEALVATQRWAMAMGEDDDGAHGVPALSVDGGWDERRLADGPLFCVRCQRRLGYALTTMGLSDELDALGAQAFDGPLSPEDAYEVEAVLEAALDAGPALRDEAAAVGRRAVAAIATG